MPQPEDRLHQYRAQPPNTAIQKYLKYIEALKAFIYLFFMYTSVMMYSVLGSKSGGNQTAKPLVWGCRDDSVIRSTCSIGQSPAPKSGGSQ